jgi:hypothetical protein
MNCVRDCELQLYQPHIVMQGGEDGRVCLPRSGCPKGMYAESIPQHDDTLCAKCPEGQFQSIEGFLGGSCTEWSPSCEDQSKAKGVKLVEQEPASDTADIVCKACGGKFVECKEAEVTPPQARVPGLASAEEITSTGKGSVSGNGGGSPVVQTVDTLSAPVTAATGAAATQSVSVAAGVGLADTTSVGDGSDIVSRRLVTGVPTFIVELFGDDSTGECVSECIDFDCRAPLIDLLLSCISIYLSMNIGSSKRWILSSSSN